MAFVTAARLPCNPDFTPLRMCLCTAVKLHPAILLGVIFHRSSPGLQYFVREVVLAFVILGSVMKGTHRS